VRIQTKSLYCDSVWLGDLANVATGEAVSRSIAQSGRINQPTCATLILIQSEKTINDLITDENGERVFRRKQSNNPRPFKLRCDFVCPTKSATI